MCEDYIRKRIIGKTKGDTKFSIEFGGQAPADAVQAFMEVERVARLTDIFKLLRKLCKETEKGLFIPTEQPSNQIETICLSAAASYPFTLPEKFIEKELGIPFNSYKVYATAREHDSSDCLSLDDSKGVNITLDGVVWTASLFRDELSSL